MLKRVIILIGFLLSVSANAQIVGGGPVIGGGGSGGSGTIGGTLTATDDLAVCTDGTGGSTIGACTVLNLDNLRLDGNTISSTDTNGNINLTPNGSGLVVVPATTQGVLGRLIGFAANYGLGFHSTGGIGIFQNGTATVYFTSTGVQGINLGATKQIMFGSGTSADPSYVGIDAGIGRLAAGVVKGTDASTGIRWLQGGGAAVASATAMPVPTGRVFHVTGTTTITSITSTNFQSGTCITLIFDGVLTFTDGSNLKLAGDFVTTADDTWHGCYDGTNWYEEGRSIN